MKNMSAVLVDVYALDVLSIDVAGDVRAFIYNEDTLTVGLGLVGENSTEQTRTNYQIIVFHTIFSFKYLTHNKKAIKNINSR